MEATQQAAQERLDHTLSTLRSENLDADGALGDQRPLRALADAVDSFHPDQIVIATLPPECFRVAPLRRRDRARAAHGVPVTHVVATPVGNGRAMTIIAGFSWSRPEQRAAATWRRRFRAAPVTRSSPPRSWSGRGRQVDPVEDEYLSYVTSQASRSLQRVVSQAAR